MILIGQRDLLGEGTLTTMKLIRTINGERKIKKITLLESGSAKSTKKPETLYLLQEAAIGRNRLAICPPHHLVVLSYQIIIDYHGQLRLFVRKKEQHELAKKQKKKQQHVHRSSVILQTVRRRDKASRMNRVIGGCLTKLGSLRQPLHGMGLFGQNN